MLKVIQTNGHWSHFYILNTNKIRVNVYDHEEEQEEDTVDQNEDIDDLIPFVATERASATDFRELIFKAGYEHFKSKLSLQVVQELNIMAKQLKPSNLAESLDHLAYRIINTSQSAESDHVLKLSLSRILFLVGGVTLKYTNNYFIIKTTSMNSWRESPQWS
jgi:hypothetical protein